MTSYGAADVQSWNWESGNQTSELQRNKELVAGLRWEGHPTIVLSHFFFCIFIIEVIVNVEMDIKSIGAVSRLRHFVKEVLKKRQNQIYYLSKLWPCHFNTAQSWWPPIYFCVLVEIHKQWTFMWWFLNCWGKVSTFDIFKFSMWWSFLFT